MLTVIAKIRAKRGHQGEVADELRALVEPTRSEEGCINYDLHRSETDPCVFVFYENWTSKEALQKHAESEHMKAWAKKQPDLLAHGVELQMYEMITDAPWMEE